jgi:hypothetical protein
MIKGQPRRNRVVLLVTDAELQKLEVIAARYAVTVGATAWRIFSSALRRAR